MTSRAEALSSPPFTQRFVCLKGSGVELSYQSYCDE